jgi:hypothetical protein
MRIGGESQDLDLSALNLTLNSSEDEVRRALSWHLDKPETYFSGYAIVREDEGFTVRPQAVFGF